MSSQKIYKGGMIGQFIEFCHHISTNNGITFKVLLPYKIWLKSNLLYHLAHFLFSKSLIGETNFNLLLGFKQKMNQQTHNDRCNSYVPRVRQPIGCISMPQTEHTLKKTNYIEPAEQQIINPTHQPPLRLVTPQLSPIRPVT